MSQAPVSARRRRAVFLASSACGVLAGPPSVARVTLWLAVMQPTGERR